MDDASVSTWLLQHSETIPFYGIDGIDSPAKTKPVSSPTGSPSHTTSASKGVLWTVYETFFHCYILEQLDGDYVSKLYLPTLPRLLFRRVPLAR